MTYTPHVWSRHDKLDSLALNSLEQAVGAFSGTADEATAAAATANTAAANAASSAQAAAASAALVGAPAGTAIDAHLGGDSTGLLSAVERGAPTRMFVSPTGNDSNTGLTLSTAFLTIPAAVAAMGTTPGIIVLGVGTIDVGGGYAWPANAKCGMIGQGPGLTKITASSQAGPILDLSAVGYGLDDSEFGSFSLVGNASTGSTKKGLVLSSAVSIGRCYFHDITVSNTGGACFDLGMAELCDFDRLIAWEPVGAAANDTPYLVATGAFNGNMLHRLQLNGKSVGGNVGPSGAVRFKDDGQTYSPHDNLISAPRVEAMHLTDGATIFALAGSANIISDPQLFDSNKIAGATGTSSIRLTAPAFMNFGGNMIRGVIPGNSGVDAAVDCGIDIRQSRNVVTGIKGYNGSNVIIAAGVTNTTVDLKGAYSTALKAAVIDNSGNSTNYVGDTMVSKFIGNGNGLEIPKSGSWYSVAEHVEGVVNATQSMVYVTPIWLPAAMKITSIACNVTTAGGSGVTVRMGAYASNSSDVPDGLIFDAGAVAATVAGVASIGTTQVLPAGLCWLAACVQGGTASFTSVGSGYLPPVASASAFVGAVNSYRKASVTGALPASFASSLVWSGGIKVMVQAA